MRIHSDLESLSQAAAETLIQDTDEPVDWHARHVGKGLSGFLIALSGYLPTKHPVYKPYKRISPAPRLPSLLA
jgi:hypothetical protein